MPAADCFLDTNILLYAISTQPADAPKRAIAQQLLATKRWAWSGQVAAEFVNASRSGKRSPPLPWVAVEHYISLWLSLPLVPIEGPIVLDAIAIAQRYLISYYDAQIIAAAKSAGCGTVYSEDLNHGQLYDGVRLENPFLGIGSSISGS